MGSKVQSATSPTQTPSSPALTNEVLRTEPQEFNCSIIRSGNAAEPACPEAKIWQPHQWTA